MSDNEEFIQEFLVECDENLDQLDQHLIVLEQNPRDPDRLASIFRTMHTIKGTSGFFGFSKLGALAHAGESLLSRLRDGRLVLNAEIATGLLELVDAVREILSTIESTGREGNGDYTSLASRLSQWAQQSGVDAAVSSVTQGPSASSTIVTSSPLSPPRPQGTSPNDDVELAELPASVAKDVDVVPESPLVASDQPK